MEEPKHITGEGSIDLSEILSQQTADMPLGQHLVPPDCDEIDKLQRLIEFWKHQGDRARAKTIEDVAAKLSLLSMTTSELAEQEQRTALRLQRLRAEKHNASHALAAARQKAIDALAFPGFKPGDDKA